MRHLATVLLKVVGLVQVYWLLSRISSMGSLFYITAKSPATRLSSIGGFGLLIVLSVIVIWMLLCKTDRLLDTIEIKDSDAQGFSYGEMLAAAVKLAGVYIFAQVIPLVAWELIYNMASQPSRMPARMWLSIMIIILQLGFAYILTFKTSIVLKVIDKREP